MRSAGPVDGLWRRLQPLPREQARGRGQISRRAGQDLDEPLHPVHALRALCDRSRGRSRARRHRPRRGHGDHDLSRTGDDVGAAGQRRRPLSGRRADLEALLRSRRGPGSYVKTESIDVMDALGSRHPHRHPRPRGRCASCRASTTTSTRNGFPTRRGTLSTACARSGSISPYVRETASCARRAGREAFNAIAAKVARANPKRIGAMVGDLAAVEEIFALKDLMTRLGVDAISIAGRTARRSIRNGAARAICSMRPSPASSRPTRCSSSAPTRARKRRCSTRASASAGERRRSRSASSGRRPISLTITIISAPARKRSPISAATASPKRCARPNSRWCSSAPARFARPDGAAIAALAAKAALDARRRQGRLERLQRPAQRRLARRRRSISASCRARAGWTRRQMAKSGTARRALLSRRRRDRHRAGRFRRLHRHARRPRRASRRRDPAGRRLYRENRHLRQHRRPGAVRRARRLPAGDAREDWSILRALSDPLGAKLPYDFARPNCERRSPPPIRISCGSIGSRRPMRRLHHARRARRRDRQGAVRSGRRRFLSHQSDRARLARHGRMFGAGAGAFSARRRNRATPR